jgi:uracil-DNA glycosylase
LAIDRYLADRTHTTVRIQFAQAKLFGERNAYPVSFQMRTTAKIRPISSLCSFKRDANQANADGLKMIPELQHLQQRALSITPPEGATIRPAMGGLSGPAFFPEGLGLTESVLVNGGAPDCVVIGHNFGCMSYRLGIEGASREDDKATWRNLDSLFRQAEVGADRFFRTNWFVGLLEGDKQTGKFLKRSHPQYEEECRLLLLEQLRVLRPKAILVLGPEVARRTHRIAPMLAPWANAKSWADIDRSAVGHSVRNVAIPEADIVTNVAALLHTSFGTANQSRRMQNMTARMTEAEIVTQILFG